MPRVRFLACHGFPTTVRSRRLRGTLDLDTVAPDEPPEQLCDRLAVNPFSGLGPDEWGKPFQTINSYRAIPACSQVIKNHRLPAMSAIATR